ncbi:MAG: hypothetical protein ABSF26_22140 [Thermoguttaceae bacterium]|jgi:hypothetical protein
MKSLDACPPDLATMPVRGWLLLQDDEITDACAAQARLEKVANLRRLTIRGTRTTAKPVTRLTGITHRGS